MRTRRFSSSDPRQKTIDLEKPDRESDIRFASIDALPISYRLKCLIWYLDCAGREHGRIEGPDVYSATSRAEALQAAGLSRTSLRSWYAIRNEIRCLHWVTIYEHQDRPTLFVIHWSSIPIILVTQEILADWGRDARGDARPDARGDARPDARFSPKTQALVSQKIPSTKSIVAEDTGTRFANMSYSYLDLSIKDMSSRARGNRSAFRWPKEITRDMLANPEIVQTLYVTACMAGWLPERDESIRLRFFRLASSCARLAKDYTPGAVFTAAVKAGPGSDRWGYPDDDVDLKTARESIRRVDGMVSRPAPMEPEDDFDDRRARALTQLAEFGRSKGMVHADH